MNTNRVFLLMIVGIAFCGFARADALPPVDQILSDLGLQATTQPAESPEENAANAGAWQKLFEAYKAVRGFAFFPSISELHGQVTRFTFCSECALGKAARHLTFSPSSRYPY